MNRRDELNVETRRAAGLPILYCPNCGRPEAHWVAEALDQYGLIIPGYYTCGGTK